jgi:hypothetical protein
MFRSVARVMFPVGMVSLSILAFSASAQIRMPNPIAEPNPLTGTLSIFRTNMQDHYCPNYLGTYIKIAESMTVYLRA